MIVYVLIIVVIIILDIITKQWALYACVEELLINQFLSCHLVINRGISWSLLHFDSFIGFLEDVNANIGILVTNKGYSKGAKNRAKCAGIFLEIVKPAELEDEFFSGNV